MKNPASRIPLSFLLTIAALTTASSVLAQGGDPAPKAKPEPCAVVQVGEEYRIIKASEVDELKATLKREHEAALAAHKEEVKAAKARKETGKIPAPKAAKLKVLKPSIDEAAAKEMVAKLQAKGAKKPGADKPAKKPAKKPVKEAKPAKKK